jgi:hypothetical protein
MDALTSGLAQVANLAPNPTNSDHHQWLHAYGAIRNVVAEIEGGLIVSLRAQVAREIFSDLVGLGKEVLQDDTDSPKGLLRRLKTCFGEWVQSLPEWWAGRNWKKCLPR